jgi:hypothetical protein
MTFPHCAPESRALPLNPPPDDAVIAALSDVAAKGQS